jgi:allantoinase
LSYNLVIKNGSIVYPKSIIKADIGIEEGKISIIGKCGSIKNGEREIDVDGKFILPGCIDTHVHFREPLRGYKEGWKTGSRSAAFGGVTTVLDMPESMKPTKEDMKKKLEIASQESIIDFCFFSGTSNPDMILEMSKIGVIGFKILLGYEDFYHDNGELFEVFRKISQTKLPAVVHAEDIRIIKMIEKELLTKDKKDIFAHEKSRPSFVEKEAIMRAIIMSQEVKCKLHIAHLSTKEGAEIIRNAKKNGVKVTSETCPHYLLIKREKLGQMGPYGKVNPPIRGTVYHINALWEGIHNGTIDCIATDHAPHTIQEKEVGWENIFNAAPGVIGVQTMLPLMLTEVNKNNLSIMKLVELVSTKPAKTFNLYPKKGILFVGSDADIVIVDLKKKGTIKNNTQKSKMAYTPYHGYPIQGLPETTIVRGEIIIEKGKLVTNAGLGKWIQPVKTRPLPIL